MKAKFKPWIRACAAFACSSVLAFSPVFTYAEDSVSDLEQQTQDLQTELDDLNKQLSSLSKEITSLAGKIADTNQAAEQAELDLTAAKLDEELQYRSMKKRIQFIYENGETSFFEILFTSSSMGEFLNRMDFVSQVTEYDRKMLDRLKETRNDIDQKEKNLKKQEKELDSMKQEMVSKQNELNEKISSTNGKLDASSKELAAAKEAQAAAEKALAAKQDSYNTAGTTAEDSKQNSNQSEKAPVTNENKKPAQESTSKPSNTDTQKPNTDNSTTQKPSQPADTTDLVLLAAILECEAGSSDYNALLAVATVIMNRVESPRYPNTLSGVIYQSGQFSPTWNGSLSRVLERGPKPLCYQVARDALSGKRLASVSDCYQFRAASSGHEGVVVGGNVFF